MLSRFNKYILLSLIILSQTKLHCMFGSLNKLKVLSKTKFLLNPKTNLSSRRFKSQDYDVKIGKFKEFYIKNENGQIIQGHPVFIEEIDPKELCDNKVIKIIEYLKDLETKHDSIHSEQTRELVEIKSILKTLARKPSPTKNVYKINYLIEKIRYLADDLYRCGANETNIYHTNKKIEELTDELKKELGLKQD